MPTGYNMHLLAIYSRICTFEVQWYPFSQNPYFHKINHLAMLETRSSNNFQIQNYTRINIYSYRGYKSETLSIFNNFRCNNVEW
jgi:hypothetical protein